MKDDVNAGNLNYTQGKVEFENVFFSYTQGSAASVVFVSVVHFIIIRKIWVTNKQYSFSFYFI